LLPLAARGGCRSLWLWRRYLNLAASGSKRRMPKPLALAPLP